MTELEYEKACRGPLPAVAGEYAWGNISIVPQTSHAGTDGSGSETALPENANCCYDNKMGGPVRAGIFAKPGPGSTREASGAGYWGIMELSGNINERPVTIGNAKGRAFTGLHGDGKLTAAGAADVGSWPVGGGDGFGFRGGYWSYASAYARASDRLNAANANATRISSSGGRGGRLAP